jgi:hypothetical protein
MHSLSYSALFAILLSCGPAAASTVYIDSQAGLPTTVGNRTTVAIQTHSAWQPNHPINPGDPNDQSALWISYAATGFGDAVFVPYGGTAPVGSILYTFVSGAGTLRLNVWADDTAGVLLDGSTYLALPVFSQSICSGAPIGCRPEDAGQLTAQLTAGTHTLQFDLYQTGTGSTTFSNPLGLLFTGTAPGPDEVIQDAPEPVSFWLTGSALIAAAVLTRRRRSGPRR